MFVFKSAFFFQKICESYLLYTTYKLSFECKLGISDQVSFVGVQQVVRIILKIFSYIQFYKIHINTAVFPRTILDPADLRFIFGTYSPHLFQSVYDESRSWRREEKRKFMNLSTFFQGPKNTNRVCKIDLLSIEISCQEIIF